MSTSAYTVTGITVFVRVCPQVDPSAPLSRRASAILDKKSSFASSYALKNSFISSKTRKSSLSLTTEVEKCIVTSDERTLRVVRSATAVRDGDKEYFFDKVFPEDSTQEELCISVHDHVLEVVNGFNATVICHGASKSGKSYTMTGTKDARGIIPHAIKSVFSQIDKIRNQDPDLYFYTEVGYVELYNNNFRDLLLNHGSLGPVRDDDDESVVVINEVGELDSLFDTPSATPSSARKAARNSNGSTGGAPWQSEGDVKIQVHESKNLGVFLSGSPTLRVPVSSANEVFQLYSRGQKLRSSRVTDSGHVSSRSHAVLILYVESRSFAGDGGGSTPASPDQRAAQQGAVAGLRMSKLTFVDMAGADRLEMSGAVGDTLVESQNINLSLAAFGDVLFALSKNAAARAKQQKGSQHVPYLNSKLTQLLKESLGGNAKTVLITTIHSTADYSKVTETSLQYATWASTVRGRVVRNDLNIGERWIQETDPEILRLRKLLEERSREFAKLRFAQLNRPLTTSGPVSMAQLPTNGPTGRGSFGAGSPTAASAASAGASPAAASDNSPLAKLQKRLTESSMSVTAVTESKTSFFEGNLKSKISDLELINQELKEDLARKSRQSTDLSISLKKSLELIQQQNKALTDQLTDVSHEKDAQIDALNKQLAAQEAEMAMLRDDRTVLAAGQRNQGEVDSALNAANAELERAKKSAWDRYLTITQQQERIAQLEASLQLEATRYERARRELEEAATSQTQDLHASLEDQRRALDHERTSLHAALKAAEEHVYEQEQHLQEQHASQAYQISSLKDKCEALKAELVAKDAELAKSRRSVQEGQEQLARESRLLSAECVKSSDLQASLDMHIALVASLKLKLTNLQTHVTEEAERRAEQDKASRALEAEVADLRDSLRRTQKDYDASGADLQSRLMDADSELQKLRAALSNKEATVQSLESRVASQSELVASERQASLQEVQELQDQLREQIDAHQKQTAKYLARNSEAEASEEALRATRAQLDASTAEASGISKKLAALEQSLGEERSRSGELTQGLQRAQKLHEVSVTQFTDELLELNVKLQTSENAAETLNLTVAENEKQIAFLQGKITEIMSGSEAEVFATQEELTAMDAELAELRSALERETAKNQELEAERKALRADVAARDAEKQRLLEQKQALEDSLAREVQKRKAEVEAAQEMRKEALGASKADFDEYVRLSELKVAGLSQDLAAADQRYEEVVAAFNDRLQEDQVAMRDLNLALEEKVVEIAGLHTKLAQARAERNEDGERARQSAGDAADRAAELSDAVAAQVKKYAALDAEFRAVSAQLADKQAELAALSQLSDGTRADMQAALDAQVAHTASLRLKVDVLQGTVDEETAIRQNREQRVSDLELIAADLERSLQKALRAHEGEEDELRAHLAERAAELEQGNLALQEKDATAEALAQQVAELEAQCDSMEALLAAARQRIASLEAAAADAAREMQAREAELEEALRAGAVATRVRTELTTEVTTLRSTLVVKEQTLVTEVHRYTAERAALEEQVASMSVAAQDQAAALARARADHEADRADLVAQIDELRIVVSELENAVSVKDASLAILMEKLVVQEQRTVAEVNARIAELAAYENHTAELQDTIAELQRDLQAAAEGSGAREAALNAELRFNKDRVAELGRLLDEVEQELQTTCEGLEQQRQRADSEASARQAEGATAAQQLGGLKAQVAALEAQLQNALDAHSADSLAMAKQAEDNLRATTALARELQQAREELQQTLERLAALQDLSDADAEQHNEAVRSLQEILAAAQLEAEELRETLAKSRKMHSLAEATFNAESEADQARVEEMAAARAAAEQKMAEQAEELQAALATASEEAAARAEEAALYEESRAELTAQVEELTARLAVALQSSTATASELGARLEAALQEGADLQAALQEATDNLQLAQDQCAELGARLASEEADHAAAVSALEEQLAGVLSEKADLQENLKKTRRMHDLSEATFAAESEVDQEKIEQLTEQVTSFTTQVDGLQIQLAVMQAALDRSLPTHDHEQYVQSLQGSHESSAASLQADIEELRGALAAAQKAAERAAEAQRAEVADLDAQVSAQVQSIEGLTTQLAERLKQIQDMQADANTRDADARLLQARVTALEKIGHEETEQARSVLESERQKLAELSELHSALAAARTADVQALQQELSASGAANGDLRAQLSASVEESQRVQEALQARISDIAALQTRMREAATSSEASASELREQVHSKTREVEELLVVITRLEKDSHAAGVNESDLQAEIAALQEKLIQADISYEALERKLILAVNMRTAEGEAYRAATDKLLAENSELEDLLAAARAEVDRLTLELGDSQAAHAAALDAKSALILAGELRAAELQALLAATQRELAAVQDELLQEQTRGAALATEVQVRDETISELTAAVAALEEALAAEKTALALRSAECADLQGRCAGLEGELSGREAVIAALRKMLADAEGARDALQRDLSQRDEQLAAALARLDELQRMFEQQVALVEVLRVKLGEQEELYSADAEAVRSEIADLKQALAQSQGKNAELTEAEAAAERRCAALEQQLDDLQALLDTVRADLERQLQEARSELANKAELLAAAESEVARLNHEMGELRYTHSALLAASERRQSDFTSLTERFREVEIHLQEAVAVSAATKAESEQRQLRCDSLAQQLADSQYENGDLRSQLAEALNALALSRAETERIAAELAAALARAEQLQRMFEEQVALVEVLKVKLGEQEELHGASASALQVQIKDLDQALAEAQDRIAELTAAEAAAQDMCAAMQQELDDLQTLLDTVRADLEDQLAASRDQCMDAVTALAAAEEAAQALQEKVDGLTLELEDTKNATHLRSLENSVLSQRLLDVEAQLQEARASLADQAALIAQLKLNVAELQEKLSAADAENRALTQEVREAKAAEAAARADAAAAAAKVDELQRMFEEQAALVEVLRVKLGEQEELYGADAEALRSEIADLKLALAQSQGKNAELTEAEVAAERRCAALEQQLDDLQALLDTVRADLERQLQEARGELANKAELLAVAESEVLKLTSRVAELELANDAATASAEEHMAARKALTHSLHDCETQLQEVRAALAEQVRAFDQLSASSAQVRQQLADSEAEREVLGRQLVRSETETAEAQLDAKKLAAELAAALVRVEELQRMFEEQVALVEVLKVKLDEQEQMHLAEAAELRAEIADLNLALAELQGTDREACLARDAAEKRCAALQQHLEDLQALFDTVRADMERELSASREKCAGTAAELRAKDQEAERLRDQLGDLNAVNTAVSLAAQERLVELKAMAERVAATEAQLLACQSELAEQVRLVAASEAQCVDSSNRFSAAASHAASLEGQLAAAEQARDELSERVVKLEAEDVEAKARLEVLLRMFEEQVALVEVLKLKLGEMEGLNGAEASNLRAEIEELRLALADMRDRNGELAEAAQVAEERCQELERQLDDLRALHTTLVGDLRRQVEESQALNAALAEELATTKLAEAGLRERLTDLDAVNHTVAVAAQDRLNELTAAQERLADALRLVADLQTQCEALTSQVAVADKFKTALRDEIGVRDAEMAVQEAQLEVLHGQLEASLAEAEKWRARVDELQRMFEEQVALVEVLKVKLGEQEERINLELAAAQENNGVLQDQIVELQSSGAKLQGTCDGAEERCLALEKELADLQALHVTLTAELGRQLDVARDHGVKVASQLASNEAELQRLKDAMSDLQAANHAVAVAAQDRLLEANAAKARLSDAVEQLLEMKADLDNKSEQVAAVDKLHMAAQEALQQNELQRAELQRLLLDAQHSRELSAEEVASRTRDTVAALARVEELQRLFEEQVALVEVLKVKLGEQEELHGTEVGSLKQRILDLCASLQDVQAQNAELINKNVAALTKIDALTESVEEGDARGAVLSASLHAKSAEALALQAEFQDFSSASTAKLLQLEEQLSAAQAMNATQEVSIADLHLQRANAAAELDEKAAEVAALTLEIEMLSHHYSTAEAALRKDLEEVKARNAELVGEVDQQTYLVSTLKAKLGALQEEAEACAHKLVHETAALEQCQADLSAANRNLAAVQASSEQKVADMMESIGVSQKVQELMAAQLHEQMERSAALEGDVRTKTEALVAQEAVTGRVEAELARVREDRAAAVSAADLRMAEAEKQLAALRADHAAQETFIGEIETQRKAFKAELAVKAEEMARLELQLEKLLDEGKGHAAHVTKLRVQLAAAQARLEEEGHKRIHQLAMHEQKLSELEVSKVASDHALQRYEAKVAALTAELGAFGSKKSERMSI